MIRLTAAAIGSPDDDIQAGSAAAGLDAGCPTSDSTTADPFPPADNSPSIDITGTELTEPAPLAVADLTEAPAIESAVAQPTTEETAAADLRAAEQAVCDAVLEVERAKQELKDARSAVKEAVENLMAVKFRSAMQPGAPDSKIVVSATFAGGELTGASVDTIPGDDYSSAWRTAPTTALQLHTIKGIGKKKATEICEQYPTIGDIEDLRAHGGAGAAGVGIRSIERIGEEKAQAIEDRILEWLSANRDTEVLAAAKGGECETAAPAGGKIECLWMNFDPADNRVSTK